MQQIELRVGGFEQGGRIACKAWLGIGGRGNGLDQRGLVGAGGQNGFDGAVKGTVMGQRPSAGGLQPSVTVGFAQADDTLCGAQSLKNPVRQKSLDQLLTG